MWQNINNLNCDKAQKLNFLQNSKTRIVTKLKKSNCDKTQNVQLWQNSNSQDVKKKKSNKGKTQNSIWDQTQTFKFVITQNLKLWQLKNCNCDKTKKNKSNCDKS